MDNRDESGLKNAFPCQSDCIVDKRREGDDIIHCSQLKVRLIKGDFYGRLNSHSGALAIHTNVSCQTRLSAACHVMQTVLRPLQTSTQTKKTSRRLSATVSIDLQRYDDRKGGKKTGRKINNSLWRGRERRIFATKLCKHDVPVGRLRPKGVWGEFENLRKLIQCSCKYFHCLLSKHLTG